MDNALANFQAKKASFGSGGGSGGGGGGGGGGGHPGGTTHDVQGGVGSTLTLIPLHP